MLLVDTVKGEVVDDEKLKEYYASREPMASGSTGIWSG